MDDNDPPSESWAKPTSERGRDLYLNSIPFGDPTVLRRDILQYLATIDNACCLDEWNDAVARLLNAFLYSSAGPEVVGKFSPEEIDQYPELASEPCSVRGEFAIWANGLTTKLMSGFQGKSRGRPEDWRSDRFVAQLIEGLPKEGTTVASLTNLIANALEENLDTARKRVMRVARSKGLDLKRALPFGKDGSGRRFRTETTYLVGGPKEEERPKSSSSTAKVKKED